MIKLRKHIAYLLFGIFFFPIVFQSVHMVLGHSHDIESDHEHNHCNHVIGNNDFNFFVDEISGEDFICPICDYHFSVNDLPNSFLYNPVVSAIDSIYTDIAIQQSSIKVFSNKTPRAPPVLFT